MKKQRILLVLKGSIKYLMHYRPYMTAWVSIFALGAIVEGIKKGSMGAFIVLLLFAALPAMIKRLLLSVSRIGGINRYDEKTFGKGPKGRMTNYLVEYVIRNEKI